MSAIPDLLPRLTAALAALALAGCAAAPLGQPHAGHHAGPVAATAAPPSGPFYAQEATGGGAAGSATQSGDMRGMCAMQREMAGAPNEAARRAMAERHMAGMSPEQRRQRMETMRRHCQ